MSISDNYAPDISLGNGVTTQFSGNWKVLNADYFKAALQSVATGIQTPLVQGSDYTLTFDDDGYEIDLAVAPSSAYYVVRYREVTLDQTDPYRTSKGFQGKVVEDSFDKLTSIDQDQQDQIDRSLKFQVGSSAAGYTIENPIDGRSLKWDVPNNRIINSETDVDEIVSYVTEAAAAASSSASAAAASAAAATAYSVGWLKQTVTVNPATGQNQAYFNDMVSLKVPDTTGTLVERIRVLRDGRIGIGVPNDHLAGTFPAIGIDLDIHRDYDADGITERAPSMRLDHAFGGAPTYRTDAWPVISGSTLGQFVAAFDGNEVGRIGWTAPSDSIPAGTDHINKYDGRRNTAGNFDHANFIIQTRIDRSVGLTTALIIDKYGNMAVGNTTPAHALSLYRADGNVTKLQISQNTRRDWTIGMAASSGELLITDESASKVLAQFATAGHVSLGGASSAEALRAVYTASAVNYLSVTGGTAGNRVTALADGSDTNIGLALGSKGTGNVDILGSGGTVQSRFTSTALAVNYLQFAAGTTGNRVSMIANGSDTNVNLALSSRGTGTIDLMTGSLARVGIRLVDTASSVNWFEVVPSATGSRVNIKANGSDTNVPIGLSSKGTGVLDLLTNNATVVGTRIAHVASAVNYLQISPAVAASPVKLEAVGTDTNIDLLLTPKGTGLVRTAYASTAATTPASFSAARALAINAGGTTVFVPCATALW